MAVESIRAMSGEEVRKEILSIVKALPDEALKEFLPAARASAIRWGLCLVCHRHPADPSRGGVCIDCSH